MSDLLVSVRELLEDAQRLAEMTPRQETHFHKRLNNLLEEVEDEDVKAILTELKADIGELEKRSDKVTVQMVETEFKEYQTKTEPQKTAFKAKVTRMVNEAIETGETETQNRLTLIQYKIHEQEQAELKARILKLASYRRNS